MVKRGWQHRNQKKLLEELRAMKESFPNHQFIEFNNDKIGFMGSFTIKDEEKYFKVIYPHSYPRDNPMVYLLENKEDLKPIAEEMGLTVTSTDFVENRAGIPNIDMTGRIASVFFVLNKKEISNFY